MGSLRSPRAGEIKLESVPAKAALRTAERTRGGIATRAGGHRRPAPCGRPSTSAGVKTARDALGRPGIQWRTRFVKERPLPSLLRRRNDAVDVGAKNVASVQMRSGRRGATDSRDVGRKSMIAPGPARRRDPPQRVDAAACEEIDPRPSAEIASCSYAGREGTGPEQRAALAVSSNRDGAPAVAARSVSLIWKMI